MRERMRFFCELDTISRREILEAQAGTAHRHDSGSCTECDRERAMLARFDEIAVALPRGYQAPPLDMTPIPRRHDDQEESTMSVGIDAEGVAEKAAYLREHGWFLDATDPDCWRHPRLSALPPISLTAAIELQREASIDEAEHGHNPAGPRRVH